MERAELTIERERRPSGRQSEDDCGVDFGGSGDSPRQRTRDGGLVRENQDAGAVCNRRRGRACVIDGHEPSL